MVRQFDHVNSTRQSQVERTARGPARPVRETRSHPRRTAAPDIQARTRSAARRRHAHGYGASGNHEKSASRRACQHPNAPLRFCVYFARELWLFVPRRTRGARQRSRPPLLAASRRRWPAAAHMASPQASVSDPGRRPPRPPLRVSPRSREMNTHAPHCMASRTGRPKPS